MFFNHSNSIHVVSIEIRIQFISFDFHIVFWSFYDARRKQKNMLKNNTIKLSVSICWQRCNWDAKLYGYGFGLERWGGFNICKEYNIRLYSILAVLKQKRWKFCTSKLAVSVFGSFSSCLHLIWYAFEFEYANWKEISSVEHGTWKICVADWLTGWPICEKYYVYFKKCTMRSTDFCRIESTWQPTRLIDTYTHTHTHICITNLAIYCGQFHQQHFISLTIFKIIYKYFTVAIVLRTVCFAPNHHIQWWVRRCLLVPIARNNREFYASSLFFGKAHWLIIVIAAQMFVTFCFSIRYNFLSIIFDLSIC